MTDQEYRAKTIAFEQKTENRIVIFLVYSFFAVASFIIPLRTQFSEFGIDPATGVEGYFDVSVYQGLVAQSLTYLYILLIVFSALAILFAFLFVLRGSHRRHLLFLLLALFFLLASLSLMIVSIFLAKGYADSLASSVAGLR
jgi:hypothetical protein